MSYLIVDVTTNFQGRRETVSIPLSGARRTAIFNEMVDARREPREVVWNHCHRPAAEITGDRQKNLLGQACGVESQVRCTACATGKGPMVDCIIYPANPDAGCFNCGWHQQAS